MANVRVIPALAPIVSAQVKNMTVKRRVAAYARVSTDSDEQQTSYEAQVDYYTKLIHARPDWQFISVYTDEGISAVNTKRREGFKQMVADALSGKIDLIVTKSVSRFARNTVDSLTTVRKLKDRGVEVWFEKENIYTLDSKGELLITIMSSLAQEESRSISENVTWGARKRMADGKISLPYGQFLGYEKGEDGLPSIVESEATIVRWIFRQYMEGKTPSMIGKLLEKDGISAPGGGKTWQSATVRSILTNEKYKGHALMQKTYCANFLTKKMVKNTGQVQQYYVEDSHPAIVSPDEFDMLQAEIERRKGLGRPGRCNSIFAGKIVCGDCGGLYGRKIWGSYREDKNYRKEVYQCNEKYKGSKRCTTSHVTEEQIKAGFLVAFNKLMENRSDLIEDYCLVQATLCVTSAIDAEITTLQHDLEVVSALARKEIAQTAKADGDPDCGNSYLERFRQVNEQITVLEAEKVKRLAKAKALERFVREVESRPLIMEAFDEKLWLAVVDQVTVGVDGEMGFRFRNEMEASM